VVTLAWIALSLLEDTKAGSWPPQPAFTSIAKNEILEERVRLRLWNACAWGSFEMDWLLIAILIAAVGAHLIVAGFGR
jgi:hypothetical protein